MEICYIGYIAIKNIGDYESIQSNLIICEKDGYI